MASGVSITPIFLNTEQEGSLVGTAKSDQAGTLFVDQSFDWNALLQTGDWDYTASYAVVANTGIKISESIIAPWCRIRYTNGATNQGFLRIFVRAFGTKTG